MIPVLSPQHATLDPEHTAKELELRDHVPIYTVNMVAMEIRDERLDRAIEASERMRPVVLADCGNLVVSRAEIDEFGGDDSHHVAAIVPRQPRERHPSRCGDVIDRGTTCREVKPLRTELRS